MSADIQDNQVIYEINEDCTQIIKEIDEINKSEIILSFKVSCKGIKYIYLKNKELLNEILCRDILINEMKIEIRYV